MWQLFGFEEVSELRENICSRQGPGMVLMPSPLAFTKSAHLCDMFHADMEVCQTETIQSQMNDVLLSQPEKSACKSGEAYQYWCGLTDEKTDGVWLNVNNNEVLETAGRTWHLGEPNGRDQENCIETWLTVTEKRNLSEWNDQSCENSNKCFFCNFQKRPEYTLRGLSLCQMENFDYKYKWTEETVDDRYVLRGYTGSVIYWNKNNNTWKITGGLGTTNREMLLSNLCTP